MYPLIGGVWHGKWGKVTRIRGTLYDCFGEHSWLPLVGPEAKVRVKIKKLAVVDLHLTVVVQWQRSSGLVSWAS